jgi:hypothetical protein
MMPREKIFGSWVEGCINVLGSVPKQAPRPPIRRLFGEQLEKRMVLSTAPVPLEDQGQSLEEYLAQDHQMGPIVPAEVAPSPAPSPSPSHATAPALSQAQSTDHHQLTGTIAPISVDQLFGVDQGEGEGDGRGSGSGSGSGVGSGSGSGVGSGSGSGSSSGSSSGGDPTMTDTQVNTDAGGIVVTGMISDNHGVNGVNVTLDGATGNVTVNSDGSFSIDITDMNGNNSFTIMVTDADGNSSTYTIDL